jgi:hypothetical protein
MKYELRKYRSNQTGQFDMTYVMGLCTFDVCDEDSLNAFDFFYVSSSMDVVKQNMSMVSQENVQSMNESI